MTFFRERHRLYGLASGVSRQASRTRVLNPNTQSLFYCRMYLCYVDESGTSNVPGNTSHFVLVGLSIPIWFWKECDDEVSKIKKRYALDQAEVHTAWILRSYLEQKRVPNFDSLDYIQRRSQVEQIRKSELFRLQKPHLKNQYRQTKKNYIHTQHYIHLSLAERRQFIKELATCISKWGFTRVFAECIDKVHFDPLRTKHNVDEQAFEQLVSRFEQFLQIAATPYQDYGLLIHDNNETVAKRHTELMKKFYREGTLWVGVKKIIETPLFVNSELTSMVQLADLCAYSIRRYLENNESELFDLIFQRADRKGNVVVGVRHFTSLSCTCKICSAHRAV